MRWAQAKQAEYANNDRQPAPSFQVGDQVMLDVRNIRTTRPCKSLDYKNRGPFTITRVIDNMAYELSLPAQMNRLHNVFHPWLLHLYEPDPLPHQPIEEEGRIDIEDDLNDYDVEAIENSRINKRLNDPAKRRKGLLQYLVRWANYEGDDNPSWEPYTNVTNSADLVYDFHAKNPEKPGPHDDFAALTNCDQTNRGQDD